jgi:hypothetical protein
MVRIISTKKSEPTSICIKSSFRRTVGGNAKSVFVGGQMRQDFSWSPLGIYMYSYQNLLPEEER